MLARQKVLIVADDANTVNGVRGHLEKDGYRTFVAHSDDEALKLVRRRRPDIVVVDGHWLKPDGLWVHGGSQPRMPVIVLTDDVSGEKPTSVESEVIDYVLKPVNPCEVLSRVRAALRRAGTAILEGPEELRRADLVVDRRSHQVRVRGRSVDLTPTEFRLLEVLAEDPGRAFTRLELLGRVFGYDYQGLERTVDTHVKNLRRKIELDPAEPEYVETVYGVGYRFAKV